MDTADAVLATVAATGAPLQGRTSLQKLVYFEAENSLVDAKFKPHYYGPYSEDIANAVDSLVALGYLRENVTVLGEQTDPWLAAVSGEVKVYSYELTDEGKQLAEEIRKDRRADWDHVSNLVKTIKKHSGLNPGTLSIAAKVHYMLKTTGEKAVTVAELKESAKKYHWKLADVQIERAADLLLELPGA